MAHPTSCTRRLGIFPEMHIIRCIGISIRVTNLPKGGFPFDLGEHFMTFIKIEHVSNYYEHFRIIKWNLKQLNNNVVRLDLFFLD